MEFYTEERPRVPRDTWSIRNAWRDLGLRAAGNPSPFPSVYHLRATRAPEVGQGRAEFLSPSPLPGSTVDPPRFVLCWSQFASGF